MKKGKKRIAWHPAFCAAAEFDLRENKEDLIFEREHQLTKEPLRMDLLIIKKKNDAVIKNAIGQFFRKYNIIEYKCFLQDLFGEKCKLFLENFASPNWRKLQNGSGAFLSTGNHQCRYILC